MNIELENHQEKELFINGTQVFIRREDTGPNEYVTIEVKSSGHACGRHNGFSFLSFHPRETDGS